MTHARAAVPIALALVASLGAPRDASAGATVDLLFVGRNGAPIAATNTVTAATGDTLTMAVRMRNDERLLYAGFSLHYDLTGEELDVLSAVQWQGIPVGPPPIVPFFAPIEPLEPPTPTFVGSFNGGAPLGGPTLPPASGLHAGGYQMGTVTWSATNAQTDGADIFSGLFNLGTDAFLDAIGNPVEVLFNSATVLVPEPATALLLGLGLAGCALAARRPR